MMTPTKTLTHTFTYQQGWEKVHAQAPNPFGLSAPNDWVVALEQQGKIRWHVLDAGCGAGQNALYLASLGYEVVGVDNSATAIARAQQQARTRHLAVDLKQANVIALTGYDRRFDTVIDTGSFHSLLPQDRALYAAALRQACAPGAILHLRAFSEINRWRENYRGPGVSAAQIRQAFAAGWQVQTLHAQEIQIKLAPDETTCVWAWFAEIQAE